MLRNWNMIKTVFVHLWLDKQVAKYFKMFYHQITIVLGNTVYVFKKYFSFFLLFRRPFYSKIYDTKDITILWILLYIAQIADNTVYRIRNTQYRIQSEEYTVYSKQYSVNSKHYTILYRSQYACTKLEFRQGWQKNKLCLLPSSA